MTPSSASFCCAVQISEKCGPFPHSRTATLQGSCALMICACHPWRRVHMLTSVTPPWESAPRMTPTFSKHSKFHCETFELSEWVSSVPQALIALSLTFTLVFCFLSLRHLLCWALLQSPLLHTLHHLLVLPLRLLRSLSSHCPLHWSSAFRSMHLDLPIQTQCMLQLTDARFSSVSITSVSFVIALMPSRMTFSALPLSDDVSQIQLLSFLMQSARQAANGPCKMLALFLGEADVSWLDPIEKVEWRGQKRQRGRLPASTLVSGIVLKTPSMMLTLYLTFATSVCLPLARIHPCCS